MQAFGDVCCTCLSAKCQLIPLSSEVPYLQQITYQDMLDYCTTGQEVHFINRKNDLHADFYLQIPKHICLRCSKALQVSYHFLTMLCQTDIKMQNQVVGAKYTLNWNSPELMDMDNNCRLYANAEENDANISMQEYFETAKKVHAGDMEADDISAEEFNENTLVNIEEVKEDSHLGQIPVYMNNAEFISKEKNSNSGDDLSDEIKTFPSINVLKSNNKERLKITECISNQNKIKKEDTDRDFYLQVNMNSFIPELKEDMRDVEHDIKSSLIPKYVTNTMIEESESCMSTSSNENNNALNESVITMNGKHQNPNTTSFGCQNCNYITCYAESLHKHYKIVHNMEATKEMLSTSFSYCPSKSYWQLTHECPECGWESGKLGIVKAHLKDKHQILESAELKISNNFNCTLCSRKFKELRCLRVHLECTHNTVGLFKCSKCEKSFATKFSLSVHQRYCIHGPKRLDCNLCTKRFESLRQFESHLCKEHGVELIHECEVCGKTFKNSTALSLHRKRHTDRHFQCELCPKNYINRAELKTHIERIHKKRSNFICSICNISCTSMNTLRLHENKEHFKKMHKCDFCNYKCFTATYLKIHQYIHTGMPYRCQRCPKSYAFRNFMRNHSLKVHGVKISEDELADMFRQNIGYPSRYDTFNNTKYSLHIPEVQEEDVEEELAEFGIKLDDIVKDIFNEKHNFDELLNVF